MITAEEITIYLYKVSVTRQKLSVNFNISKKYLENEEKNVFCFTHL